MTISKTVHVQAKKRNRPCSVDKEVSKFKEIAFQINLKYAYSKLS